MWCQGSTEIVYLLVFNESTKNEELVVLCFCARLLAILEFKLAILQKAHFMYRLTIRTLCIYHKYVDGFII